MTRQMPLVSVPPPILSRLLVPLCGLHNEIPSLMRVLLWRPFNTFTQLVYRLQSLRPSSHSPCHFPFSVFVFISAFYTFYCVVFLFFVTRKRWLSSTSCLDHIRRKPKTKRETTATKTCEYIKQRKTQPKHNQFVAR